MSTINEMLVKAIRDAAIHNCGLLEPGQVWTTIPGGMDDHYRLYRIEAPGPRKKRT